jgi:hypothetical protein
MELGSTKNDIFWDYTKGYITFPSHESVQPGHVFHVATTSIDHGVSHVLMDDGVKFGLFTDLDKRKDAFDAALRHALPSVPLLSQFRTREETDRWAECEFGKVLLLPLLNMIIHCHLSPLDIRTPFLMFALKRSPGRRLETTRWNPCVVSVCSVVSPCLRLGGGKFLGVGGSSSEKSVVRVKLLGIVLVL